MSNDKFLGPVPDPPIQKPSGGPWASTAPRVRASPPGDADTCHSVRTTVPPAARDRDFCSPLVMVFVPRCIPSTYNHACAPRAPNPCRRMNGFLCQFQQKKTIVCCVPRWLHLTQKIGFVLCSGCLFCITDASTFKVVSVLVISVMTELDISVIKNTSLAYLPCSIVACPPFINV